MTTSKFNSSKLRGRIVEKYGTISNFCKAIEMNRSLVSQKLNGKSIINRENIILFSNALDIPDDEIGAYFFTN